MRCPEGGPGDRLEMPGGRPRGPPLRPKNVLARPGTRGPSILHQSTSKSAIRDPRDIPGRRITARVDLEGSRGLESLPGALFFSRSDVIFFEKVPFLPEKNRRRQRTRTSNKGWEPAAGRPKSGVSKKCSRSLWGAPGAPPESPGAPGGALGAPKGPKMPPGGHGALGAPMGPRCAAGLARSALYSCCVLCGAQIGPYWTTRRTTRHGL